MSKYPCMGLQKRMGVKKKKLSCRQIFPPIFSQFKNILMTRGEKLHKGGTLVAF